MEFGIALLANRDVWGGQQPGRDPKIQLTVVVLLSRRRQNAGDNRYESKMEERLAAAAAMTYGAPIWEVAFGVTTNGPPVLDPYRVEELHRLLADQFPNVDRQPPFGDLQLFAGEGAPIQQFPQLSFQPFEAISPSRWWFVSPGQELLVQVQENFVALNWRRLILPPEPGPSYPGYDAMKATFFKFIATLRTWKAGQGQELATPAVVELLYDNFVVLDRQDGTRWTKGEVMRFWNPEVTRFVTGFNAAWTEAIKDYDKNGARLRFSSTTLGSAVNPEKPVPINRLQLAARAATGTWEETETFFDAAHEHIHSAFAALTTDEIRATWSEQWRR